MKQSHLRFRASFDFEEEELTYVFIKYGVKTGSSIAYHKIPGRAITREIRVWWLKYVTAFYLMFCMLMSLHYVNMNDIEQMLKVFFFSTIIFLIVGLIAYSYRHGGVTVLAVSPEIVILHDGQQEAIVEEIMKRRRLMMKSRMAQVDTHQPYYEEASKFSWLKEEEVVSQEEYAKACEKIAVMRDKALFGERGNMRQGLDKDTTGK